MYRKFTANQLFNGYRILPPNQVLITDEEGVIIEIVEKTAAGDGIERLPGMLTPAFVNAHCHLELSHLKGMIPEKTGLVDFVQLVMSTRLSGIEMVTEAMLKAEAEMYQNGIIAVGDICNTAISLPVKAQSKLCWHNFVEASGVTDATAENRLDSMRQHYKQFKTTVPWQKTTLSPHAPYSVSKTLFQLLNNETKNQLITIHNQECAAENELYQDKKGRFLDLYRNFNIDISSFEPTGKSSLQSWLPWFSGGQSIIAVHNTFTSEADLAFSTSVEVCAGKPIFYCLCVNANKYIEQCTPPVDLLRRTNKTIVLGTDSYASNHHLDILEEIKTIQLENSNIPLEEILQWATANGAKALQLDHTMGSFEKGKKPGIVLIEGMDDLKTMSKTSARRIL